MTTRTRHKATLGTAATAALFVLLCTQATAASTVSPLPPSEYTVRSACPPPAPGHAGCLALELVARTAQARAHNHPLGVASAQAQRSSSPEAEGDFGLRPQDLHAAYELTSEASSKQTIALVDAYNDLSAEEDLAVYSNEFALPACTTANGCFKKVNQNGEAVNLPFPATKPSLTAQETLCSEGHEEACALVEEADGWTLEISLDIETAHAICHNCDITLLEADSPSFSDLEAAEESAVHLGAGEISNSWGGPECIAGSCVPDSAAFNHPGVVITAAAGDDGYLNWLQEGGSSFADFPASSPQVVAVGGTRLSLGAQSKRTAETVWNDGGESAGQRDGHGAGGGGCSSQFPAQSWQRSVSDWSSVGCEQRRSVADVAADADPYSGLAVYDSSPGCESPYEEEIEGEAVELIAHWCPIGGTSLASPLIASVFALAGGANGVSYPAQTLYANAVGSPASLHDVTAGSNGECTSPFDEQTGQSTCTATKEAETSCALRLTCRAGVGYDGPTGVGTPNGISAFQPPTGGLSEEPSGGEEGSGSEGGGSGGSGGGGGGTPRRSPAAATVFPQGEDDSFATPTGTPGASLPGVVQLSGFALTIKALIALDTGRPKIPDLAFTFMSNVPVKVRVSLDKRVRTHGHAHWKALGHSLAIAAVSGRNSRHLSGHGVLSPGTYRLSLTPVRGTARSIVFKIG